MSKITLASYTIRIKDKETGEYMILDDFLPKTDFLTFVQEYFKFIEREMSNDEENQKLLQVNNQTIKSIKRELTGVIETGEYGYESKIVDTKKGKLKYKREVTDAEMLPFYFLLSLPKGKDKGIVILQRFGLFGMAKIFQASLNLYLKTIHPNFSVEFSPLVSTDIVRKFIDQGEVTKIIFRKFEIPKDYADYFDTKNPKDVNGYIEFSMVATRHSNFPIKNRLNKYLFGTGVNKLIEIKNFEYNSVKIEVKQGNDTRLIDLGNFNSFRAYYDVTKEITKGKDGHPTFISVDAAAKKLLSELNSILYPDQNAE